MGGGSVVGDKEWGKIGCLDGWLMDRFSRIGSLVGALDGYGLVDNWPMGGLLIYFFSIHHFLTPTLRSPSSGCARRRSPTTWSGTP